MYKSHNKTLLLYHLVFPVKYRREVFKEGVSQTLKGICIDVFIWYFAGKGGVGYFVLRNMLDVSMI
jgi:REP element-mobilizing transposase RayT